MSDAVIEADKSGPKNHRTIDRVTRILEEVVYQPGITFAELARALDAPKSSVHGFIQGLLAKAWLHEADHRFYLGPAVYGLTLASGHLRAGMVRQEDLDALHDETGMAVFLGVDTGDHLIYIGESGSDALTGFAARSNIRRTLVSTAGGKALLADWPDAERSAYLRRNQQGSAEDISRFLSEFADITKSRVAINTRHHGSQLALATVVKNHTGETVAAVTLVGDASVAKPREAKLKKVLLKHADLWAKKRTSPREPV